MLLGKLPVPAQKAFASSTFFNAELDQKVTKKSENVETCSTYPLKSLMIADFD